MEIFKRTINNKGFSSVSLVLWTNFAAGQTVSSNFTIRSFRAIYWRIYALHDANLGSILLNNTNWFGYLDTFS